MKIGIITFHATPNYGATLQCYALSKFLEQDGHEVEVINYVPLRNVVMYLRSMFLGKRRALANLKRVAAFYRFVRTRLPLSGRPVTDPRKLNELGDRYDLAFTGSDEVWKVDHMRSFDPSFYLDFCNPERTRICAYAASASKIKEFKENPQVAPLLGRFSGLGVRDPQTACAVREITGRDATLVLDPTLLYDGWANEDLPPFHDKPYVAVYAWPSDEGMRAIQEVAGSQGLEVVCVGCHHRLADVNYLGIGPWEWLRLIKHSSLVVTDFFHGVIFSLIFDRPFFAYVNRAKRLKLEHALGLVGLGDRLHSSAMEISRVGLQGCTYDGEDVRARLKAPRQASSAYVYQQTKLGPR